MAGKAWLEDETNFLKENFVDMTCEEIGKIIGRTTRSVRHKYLELKLARPQPVVGDKIARLTIQRLELEPYIGQNCTFAYCLCECGKEHKAKLSSMVAGTTQSCGCIKKETSADNCRKLATHNLSKTALYRKWAGMKSRCLYPSQPGYKNYGGRGIMICDEWLYSFENFYRWSMNNGYKERLTLDRIDTNGNYSPDNCRYITDAEQKNNTTKNVFVEAFGERKTTTQWEADERCMCSAGQLRYRIRAGWEPEMAIRVADARRK